MAHCSIIECNSKQVNNSEVPQRRKSCLSAFSRDIHNISSIYHVFDCSDHFKDKHFDKSWNLQDRQNTDRPIKRKIDFNSYSNKSK